MDLEYVKDRNKLIPIAEDYANEIAGPEFNGEGESMEWVNKWNQAFHTKMDYLWELKCETEREDYFS
ncbi:hypothetical protein [Pseudoalteromonas sp.]|uniref:hypothetical protein n=1 Tax=Pseudoalteromonas sp. TaxID=53249 RepID=UPI0026176A0F|nr:hypothetical protein [Pseudoalteromonas sp.]MCP4585372.1 hypothetical protein [Pseudoalteromonas sp.]